MGMARNPDNARITVTLRLPVELVDSLDLVAEARILGRAKLVELLLMDGLQRLDPVESGTRRSGCSNCGFAIVDHCDVHHVPCCPGSCDVSPTASVTPGFTTVEIGDNL